MTCTRSAQLALAVCAAGQAAAPAQVHAQHGAAIACYEGVIGAGPRLRRVIFAPGASGAGTLHLYSRPPRTLALDTMRLAPGGSAAHVRVASADGLITLVADDSAGTSVARLTMRSARDTVHATLRRAPAAIDARAVVGNWSGAVGPIGVVRLGASIGVGPCGLLVGTFDTPDQGQRDLPMTGVVVRGDSLVMEAGYIDLTIALPMRGADERPARMYQGGVRSDIVLRRGAPLANARRVQDPERPYPYSEREVTFASRAAGIRIAGTLTLPNTPGPHPAIVLISGSGAQDRDETVAGHRPFLVLADRLTRRGYAVLRTDDRGVGGSTGNVSHAGLHDIADDVRGAVDHLRTLPGIDGARVGLLGHSEGGYVAPIVAASDASIAFSILLGAPAVRGRDVLVAQHSALARASGASGVGMRVDSLRLARLFELLDRRPDDAMLERLIDSTLQRWMRELPPGERAVAESLQAGRTAVQDSVGVALWRSPWFKSLYAHDPAPYLRAARAPVLALIGDRDLQVPPWQSVPAFASLFAGDRRRLLTLHRVPGVNHMLQPASTGRMEEYVTIEQTIADDVLRRLVEWLARTVPVAAAPK